MKRQKAREEAVKLVYQMEMMSSAQEVMDIYVTLNNVKEDDLAYIEGTVMGVEEHKEELDEKISPKLNKWTIDRISKISLAAMRVAVYEMLYTEDVNAAVAISEAVKIVTSYDDPENAAFVNGVLGSVARDIG
ncbi:MAG: transcription antitermination factor NusB [Eubacteriales bacterium]|nr:transcription antitermination factor NusB [Eubacteriales bacterium]